MVSHSAHRTLLAAHEHARQPKDTPIPLVDHNGAKPSRLKIKATFLLTPNAINLDGMGSHVFYRWCLVATILMAGSVQAENICQGNPADVFFLLDSSGSISGPDFLQQLEFVKGVVDIFDVSPDMTRVGALSFSNWAFVDFHMDTYQSKAEVQEAIGRIHQIRGDTNTAAALAYMRDVAFTEAHGARNGVPRIAVVLTDGKSNKPWMTARMALRARLAGIHVFAIGIGNEVDVHELEAIASTPSAKYVFTVGSFSALRSIRELLAIETCKVTVTDPPTTLPPTTTQPPPPKQACGDAKLVDLVFGVSPNGSPENTVNALEFYSDVSSTFDVANDLVRIGLVPKECTAVPELNVQGFTDKDDLNRQLDVMQIVRKTPASVLRYMRQVSFNPENGARRGAKRIGVIIIDEADVRDRDDIIRAVREATMTKLLKNVELYVIGIGKSIDRSDLDVMATTPSDEHVLHVDDYDQLLLAVDRLRKLICPEPGQESSPQ